MIGTFLLGVLCLIKTRSLLGRLLTCCDSVIRSVTTMLRKIQARKQLSVTLKNADSPYVTPTKEDDPVLPALFVFQGMRGSGKTYSCVQMCRHFEKRGYIQRTFLLCPTAGESDQKDTVYSNLKTLKDDDVCTDIRTFEKALDHVQLRVKKDWEAYEHYKEHLSAYKKWTEGKKLTMEEQMILENQYFLPPFKEVKPKRHMLILDDCQGTDVYTTSRAGALNHLAIKHRHIPITICFLCQNWVGCPRALRLNATQYCIFRTGDKTQLDQIYSCFANNVTRKEFDMVYDEATSQKHGFLYIDVVPKKPHMRFRSGFNTYLVIDKDQKEIRRVRAKGEPSLRTIDEEENNSDSDAEDTR